ncbi:Uncharacterised protein [Pseudomonas luteola]|uniref:Uncharacterized protein n=2 Tax=Pseudomonas luteola TaxID=47886 RepID=A0A2X2C3K3_PSELU|nr:MULTISPECIES: hypothetical protein [Pseudomonas]MBA1251024.1 hypothetical protein [Pseudomonas zeshuii]MBH3441754.1 hypothetical protein [Pseudomonas luteola]SPY99909.1 Uncharacterised protein [Pseudomonas luteola]SPZ00086.1 Uncharacterised protein [Pseudomonas luteola]
MKALKAVVVAGLFALVAGHAVAADNSAVPLDPNAHFFPDASKSLADQELDRIIGN